MSCRRYRCRACAAVLLVVPAELLPRHRYTTSAIALALALWGLGKQTAAAVRQRVSAWGENVGYDEVGFRSLRRWAGAIKAGRLLPQLAIPQEASLRQVAAAAAQHLASFAPPDDAVPLVRRAMRGAKGASW